MNDQADAAISDTAAWLSDEHLMEAATLLAAMKAGFDAGLSLQSVFAMAVGDETRCHCLLTLSLAGFVSLSKKKLESVGGAE